MGKTFAYNTGELEDPLYTLRVVRGLFFDGTKNNMRNTEIRKKIEGVEEYEGQPANDEERRIFRKHAMERTWRNLWLKKTRVDDDSFGNDFTNVARTYKSSDASNYAIYIEGIGTTNEEGDATVGYAWGTWETGIIAKVKSGCEKLADKVKTAFDKKRSEGSIESITIVVDVFGFSRGAAAARNFVYNLGMGAYEPRTYTPPVQGGQSVLVDHDQYGISESYLKDGKLPALGHLGTELLKKGFSRDIVDRTTIIVRFLGVYDTVASYNPDAPLPNPLPNFERYIGRLHLHDLGAPQRAIHFTAMNEHRENFSLTRMNIGIERNFPGVHSDIGGSYVHNAEENIEKLETSRRVFISGLEKYREELISQHWFKEDQITLDYGWGNLSTHRVLSNRYSYIPLHFMYDYSQELVGSGYLRSIPDAAYIIDDELIQDAKEYLQFHTIEQGNDWEFLTDDELAELRKQQQLQQAYRDLDIQMEQPIEDVSEESKEKEDIPVVEIEEVVVIGRSPQVLLRKLRNGYLHWSARREGTGMDPNTDRNRQEF